MLDPAVPLRKPCMRMQGVEQPSSMEPRRPHSYMPKPKNVTLAQLFAFLLSAIVLALPISLLAQESNFPSPTSTGSIGSKDESAVAEIKEYFQAVSASGNLSHTQPSPQRLLALEMATYIRTDAKFSHGSRVQRGLETGSSVMSREFPFIERISLI